MLLLSVCFVAFLSLFALDFLICILFIILFSTGNKIFLCHEIAQFVGILMTLQTVSAASFWSFVWLCCFCITIFTLCSLTVYLFSLSSSIGNSNRQFQYHTSQITMTKQGNILYGYNVKHFTHDAVKTVYAASFWALALFCKDCQLVEVISMLHGQSPVPTHQCSQQVIDGIYMSTSILHDAKGGFLPFEEVTSSNHCTVWVDIRAAHIDMAQTTTITSHACHWLNCQDPHVVARYNQVVQHAITTNR